MKDIFALQDVLAMKIFIGVGLKITIGEDALAWASASGPKSLDVYLKMMRAVQYLRVFNIDDNNRARLIADEIIAIEPDFWCGYHILGSTHMMDYFLGSTKDPAKSIQTAIQYLEKAVALSDSAKGMVYHVLGYLYSMKREYGKAIELGQRAIELVPNGAEGYAWLGMSLNFGGKAQEAIPLFEKAIRLNRRNVASLVNDLEVPTIGAMNGPGFHSELCLMCDITICTEDTVIFDPHFAGVGSVPGDGIQICFQELLGAKRAAYALLTGHPINARKALELGLVNEVVPRDRLIPRAREIAALIMRQHRTIRRLTSQVIRRPWRRRVADDLDGGFGMQMFGHLAKGKAVHAEVETDGHEAGSFLGEFEKIRTRE